MSKTIESILTRLANEHENNYASFPAFVENELSLDIYELVCKAAEEYAHQSPLSDEEIEKLAEKECPYDNVASYENLNYKRRGFIAGFKSRQQGSDSIAFAEWMLKDENEPFWDKWVMKEITAEQLYTLFLQHK